MFRDGMKGFDKILYSDIPECSVILVTGEEGTLKSGLVFSMMSRHLSSSYEHGLYITLEQTRESHIRNMHSLGIQKSEFLHIFDYGDLMEEWKDEQLDLMRITDEIIEYYKDKYEPLTVFALDSLNALYALSPEENVRKNMYHFFSNLKDNMVSFLITEKAPWGVEVLDNFGHPEHFLADGVIELGVIEASEGVKRYIQIRKMRAVRHKMEKHQIVVAGNGLCVLGPIY